MELSLLSHYQFAQEVSLEKCLKTVKPPKIDCQFPIEEAVVLLGLFILVLCWLFFSGYTCCPCRRRRNREPELPTHLDSSAYPPTVPSQPSQLYPYSQPSQLYPPSAPVFHTVTPSESPKLELKFATISLRQVIRVEQGILTLDLHQMTVKEAVQVTNEFLTSTAAGQHRVQIITGRGVHSEGGVPKVKPVITELLKEKNLKFTEKHKGGCFEVIMPR
ncbi:hypothetical protein SK128_000985 [Halocaridina rubra]|uniref:Smr domain-containing protein n=1 Tax=Halocaridina rubra TaxID=373956 RepID=A0AAN8ZZN2_HALRR